MAPFVVIGGTPGCVGLLPAFASALTVHRIHVLLENKWCFWVKFSVVPLYRAAHFFIFLSQMELICICLHAFDMILTLSYFPGWFLSSSFASCFISTAFSFNLCFCREIITSSNQENINYTQYVFLISLLKY